MNKRNINLYKKMDCTSMMFALLFIGIVQTPTAALAEDDANVIISRFFQMLNEIETETKLELTFPVVFPAEDEQSDWNTQVDLFAEEMVQCVGENLREVLGEGAYVPAEYAVPMMEANDGRLMYWYSSENSNLIAMQLQRKDSLYDWTLSLSRMVYEPMKADLTGMPFELEYNMNDEEIREALKGQAVCSGVVEEGDPLGENSVYTVFLPEHETIEYIQIAAQTLDHLQYLPPTYLDVDLDIPSDRKLWKATYYLSYDTDDEMVLEELNVTWGNGMMIKTDYGNGWLEQWTAEVATEDRIDTTLLKEALPEDMWSVVWNRYEKIRFDYGHITDPSYIIYDGEVQVMIPVVLEGLEKSAE